MSRRKRRTNKFGCILFLAFCAVVFLYFVWGIKNSIIILSSLVIFYIIFKLILHRWKRPIALPTNQTRFIPDWIKREVILRDGGRCTHTNWLGLRCNKIKDLEYDHIEPWSKGGENTIENLRLLCKKHNRSKGASV